MNETNNQNNTKDDKDNGLIINIIIAFIVTSALVWFINYICNLGNTYINWFINLIIWLVSFCVCLGKMDETKE